MRSRKTFLATTVAAVFAGFQVAHSQGGGAGWAFECIDPANTAPYSDDYATSFIGDGFMGVSFGVSGTVTFGGATGPCYAPNARTLNAAGRFAFFNPGTGSEQSDFDDNLFFTMGAPRDPVGDYTYVRVIRFDPAAAATTADDAKTFLFGAGLRGHYVGLSNRYFIAIDEDGGCRADLRVDVIADAARLRWNLTNTGTTNLTTGIKFACSPWMRAEQPYTDPLTGITQPGNQVFTGLRGATTQVKSSSDAIPYSGYLHTPETRPVREGRNWLSTDIGFPSYVSFMFGQTLPYGLRVDNLPNDSVPDQTPVSQFIIDDWNFLVQDNNISARLFNDPNSGDPVLNPGAPAIKARSDVGMGSVSFVQTFQPQTIPPNAGSASTATIIHYVRTTWSNSSYATTAGDNPSAYSAMVDSPFLIANDPTTGDLAPNPMQIKAYVENYLAELDQEITLKNIKVSISLPADSGLTLLAGESVTKTIQTIAPGATSNVSWQVATDGTALGEIPYTVTFEPTPGPKKVLTGKIVIAANPTIRIGEGANLVSFPWAFNDTSLDAILGLVGGQDYVAYKWNPDVGEYVPATTAERGQAIWIVPVSDQAYITLNGAKPVADNTTGGAVTNLRPGWNQIGNPYSYPLPVSQLVAFAEDNPSKSLTWAELVASQLVSPSLAYWQRDPADPTSGSYSFTQTNSDLILPNRGYWIYVSSFTPIRLSWPPVFAPGLPGSDRGARSTPWQQTDKKWRLNLVARTEAGMDSGNFIGIAPSKAEATNLRIYEPPRSPKSSVEMSILEDVNGKPTRLAQSLTEAVTRKEWKMSVRAGQAGDVTVTWPNMNSIPRNVKLQIVDTTTNTTRDMRFVSSYTFRADQAGTREFKVQMEPSVATKAVIGNVIIARPSKDPRAPFTINYSLSSAANTTIRVLGGAGKEVYTVTRGRADRVGENTATWTMRDNANRAVAPGVYQVEIVAETNTGERVRKIVPVNVVR
ncbi:MAG: hypothetical protein K8R88_02970 [Armatimonadetes bacterium]|nr:hypothetical protein [Armatimonadota bacterium]